MKKIIGIFGVMVFSAAMFLNTTNSMSLNGLTLDSLITLNSANAETCEQNCLPSPGDGCWDAFGVCTNYSSWISNP